ncbi:MAG: hypothetical protein OXU20_08955 [Myxococcales bacterium]|nr:hypothetical protein [Myxococcales bacterium]
MKVSWKPWFGVFMACSIGACAASRSPRADRQTHWVEVCATDAGCASPPCLACGCAWARACTRDADCRGQFDGPGICRRRAPDDNGCRGASEARFCMPACAEAGDCEGTTGLETFEPPPTIQCDELREPSGLEGIDLIAVGPIGDFDATASAVTWATDRSIVQGEPDGSNATIVTQLKVAAGALAMDGPDIVWAEANDTTATLRSVTSSDRTPLELGRYALTEDWAVSLALSSEHVIWLADGTLLRSPRTPGSPEAIPTGPGWLLPHALTVSPSHIYYLQMHDEAESTQLLSAHRVPLSGHAPEEPLARGIVTGLAASDNDVFMAFASGALDGSESDRPARIERMPIDETRRIVMAVMRAEPLAISTNGDNLYWLGVTPNDPFASVTTLWEMPSDGRQSPTPQVAVRGMLSTKIVAPMGGQHVYVLGTCYADDAQETVDQYLVRIGSR